MSGWVRSGATLVLTSRGVEQWKENDLADYKEKREPATGTWFTANNMTLLAYSGLRVFSQLPGSARPTDISLANYKTAERELVPRIFKSHKWTDGVNVIAGGAGYPPAAGVDVGSLVSPYSPMTLIDLGTTLFLSDGARADLETLKTIGFVASSDKDLHSLIPGVSGSISGEYVEMHKQMERMEAIEDRLKATMSDP
jgi:hypothetical protein